jgi:hypothetical protein
MRLGNSCRKTLSPYWYHYAVFLNESIDRPAAPIRCNRHRHCTTHTLLNGPPHHRKQTGRLPSGGKSRPNQPADDHRRFEPQRSSPLSTPPLIKPMATQNCVMSGSTPKPTISLRFLISRSDFAFNVTPHNWSPANTAQRLYTE